LTFFTVVLCFMLPVSATRTGVDWYCAHVKGHVQPTVGRDIAFAEEEGAYFIDRSHTEPDSEDKVLYLTFDAGYENGNVEKILDVLKEQEVPAAFFILGNLVTKNASLVKRMAEEGHTVCNHTVSHKDMSRVSDKELLEELHALESLYETHVGGTLSRFYRPPEGRFSRENLICARENGYITVFWSFAYPDWDNQRQMSADKAKKIIMENVHNGEIMLLHPTSETNAAILRDVIVDLKAQGYRFGTLDELTAQGE